MELWSTTTIWTVSMRYDTSKGLTPSDSVTFGVSTAGPRANPNLALRLVGAHVHIVFWYKRYCFITWSEPWEPYDAKLLRFLTAGYRQVGDSKIDSSFWLLDTAYSDALRTASETYYARLLRSTVETFCMDDAAECWIPYYLVSYDDAGAAHEAHLIDIQYCLVN